MHMVSIYAQMYRYLLAIIHGLIELMNYGKDLAPGPQIWNFMMKKTWHYKLRPGDVRNYLGLLYFIIIISHNIYSCSQIIAVQFQS